MVMFACAFLIVILNPGGLPLSFQLVCFTLLFPFYTPNQTCKTEIMPALYSYNKEIQVLKEQERVLLQENEALKQENAALKQENEALYHELRV